jgi:hypothetical protein
MCILLPLSKGIASRAEQIDSMTTMTQIMTEADTCRELVTPKLIDAGWGSAPHVIGEQRTFDALQSKVAALKARHANICQANDALIPATLERVFSGVD